MDKCPWTGDLLHNPVTTKTLQDTGNWCRTEPRQQFTNRHVLKSVRWTHLAYGGICPNRSSRTSCLLMSCHGCHDRYVRRVHVILPDDDSPFPDSQKSWCYSCTNTRSSHRRNKTPECCHESRYDQIKVALPWFCLCIVRWVTLFAGLQKSYWFRLVRIIQLVDTLVLEPPLQGSFFHPFNFYKCKNH